jgi:hypothetical protein
VQPPKLNRRRVVTLLHRWGHGDRLGLADRILRENGHRPRHLLAVACAAGQHLGGRGVRYRLYELYAEASNIGRS